MLRIERDNRLSNTEKFIFAGGCLTAAALASAFFLLALAWSDLEDRQKLIMAEHAANKERLSVIHADHSDTLESVTTAIEAQRRLRALVASVECDPFRKKGK